MYSLIVYLIITGQVQTIQLMDLVQRINVKNHIIQCYLFM